MPEIHRVSREEARRGAERAAEILAAEPSVRLVFLYGSAAADDGPDRVRDADLAVLVDPAPDPEAWRHLEAAAARAAGVPLDLVPLHRATIVLAREVAVTGECLFARTAEEETDFVVGANARYLDFKPYLDEQFRISGERAWTSTRSGSRRPTAARATSSAATGYRSSAGWRSTTEADRLPFGPTAAPTPVGRAASGPARRGSSGSRATWARA